MGFPRPLGGPALSDRLSGPGAGERASALFLKMADPELPQQQPEVREGMHARGKGTNAYNKKASNDESVKYGDRLNPNRNNLPAMPQHFFIPLVA